MPENFEVEALLDIHKKSDIFFRSLLIVVPILDRRCRRRKHLDRGKRRGLCFINWLLFMAIQPFDDTKKIRHFD